MFLKQNIPKLKKVLQTLSIAAIVLVCTLTINTIETRADAFDSWAQSIVDSQGSDSKTT